MNWFESEVDQGRRDGERKGERRVLLKQLRLRFGGADGVRSQALLLSAVMAPRATWDGAPLHPSLAEMAGAYAFGLARNHAFVDGNKRTAFVIAIAFLEANGVALTVGSEWIAIIEGLAAGTVSRDELVAKLVEAMPDKAPVLVEP